MNKDNFEYGGYITGDGCKIDLLYPYDNINWSKVRISGFSLISGEWFLTDGINYQKAPYFNTMLISGNK